MKNILFDEDTEIMGDSDLGEIFVENFSNIKKEVIKETKHFNSEKNLAKSSILKESLENKKEVKMEEAINLSELPETPEKLSAWRIKNRTEGRAKREAAYRSYAGLSDKDVIEEGKLDRAALRKVAGENNLSMKKLAKELCSEKLEEAGKKKDPAIDKAEKELEKVPGIDGRQDIANEYEDEDSEIWQLLDKSLETARRQHDANFKGQYPNVGLIGLPGVGKTSIVEQWAEARGINLFMKPAPAIGSEDLMGVPQYDPERKRVVMAPTGVFDELDEPNTVFFVDEFNRSRSDVRNALLTLIASHKLPDPAVKGQMRYLPNFLFTIAAINPTTTSRGASKMDTADTGRFEWIDITAQNDKLLRYLTNEYKSELNQFKDDPKRYAGIRGRLAIATKILTDDDFMFTTREQAQKLVDEDAETTLGWNNNFTEPRQFTAALENSDGTKEDFLAEFGKFCNNLDEEMVEDILSTYDEADDEAINALLYNSESDLLKAEKSNSQKAKSLLRKQGKIHV